jgi:hypothetical protein
LQPAPAGLLPASFDALATTAAALRGEIDVGVPQVMLR